MLIVFNGYVTNSVYGFQLYASRNQEVVFEFGFSRRNRRRCCRIQKAHNEVNLEPIRNKPIQICEMLLQSLGDPPTCRVFSEPERGRH